MIFNLIATVILIAFLFSGITTHDDNHLSSAELIYEQNLDSRDTLSTPSAKNNPNLERFFDIDGDRKFEKFTVFSTWKKEIGDEITKIYINDNETPNLILQGYFDGIDIHAMNPQGFQVLEVRTADGHSIDTTFYTYKNGQLKLVPVSTSKPPSFYGIVSRNKPEFKDIDNNGTLELLAYYRHFPPEKKRTVEVYKFNRQKFTKTQEYEESLSNMYF